MKPPEITITYQAYPPAFWPMFWRSLIAALIAAAGGFALSALLVGRRVLTWGVAIGCIVGALLASLLSIWLWMPS